MKYKIQIFGRGGECYIHLLNDDKHEKLFDGGVEQDMIDSQDIADILEKPDVFSETDDIFLGTYTENHCIHIKVTNENDVVVWESTDDEEFETEYEYKFVDDRSLIVLDDVKGEFFSYDFEIDEEFKSENLKLIVTELGERIELITSVTYNDVDLESFKDYGDYWSKGLTYFLI